MLAAPRHHGCAESVHADHSRVLSGRLRRDYRTTPAAAIGSERADSDEANRSELAGPPRENPRHSRLAGRGSGLRSKPLHTRHFSCPRIRPYVRDRLGNGRRAEMPGRSALTAKVAPRPVSATVVIAAVLRTSDEPLGIADVLQRVEQMLGRSIKRGSLKSALAEMAASDASSVRACGPWTLCSRRPSAELSGGHHLLNMLRRRHREAPDSVGSGPGRLKRY